MSDRRVDDTTSRHRTRRQSQQGPHVSHHRVFYRKAGLKLEQELGMNPYKFGRINSTDAHTGLAAVDEDNFCDKTSSSEPSPERATHPFVKATKATIMEWEQTASGYAGVWATDNTREALFDAMQGNSSKLRSRLWQGSSVLMPTVLGNDTLSPEIPPRS
jgi:hypothetical protein